MKYKGLTKEEILINLDKYESATNKCLICGESTNSLDYKICKKCRDAVLKMREQMEVN